MKEHRAAIQAVRIALGQALDVYHRINHSIPTFRDVAHRVRELQQQTLNQSSRKGKSAMEKRSWFSSAVDNVHRFLIGSRK